MIEKKEIRTCHRILYVLVLTGFMLYQMQWVNLPIAIVDMLNTSENNTSPSKLHFNWTEKQKGNLLGAYFLGQVLTAIPGGRLAETYSAKLVIGYAMLIGSIMNLLSPLAAYWSYYALLLVRIILGLALAACTPAVPALAVKWFKFESAPKLLAQTKAIFLGGAFSMPLFGFLIANLGWQSVFYVTGSCSFVWSLLWFYFVYDSPEKHPRISARAAEELKSQVADNSSKRGRVPWMKFFTSVPVWANILSGCSFFFSVNVVFNYLPTFMAKVLKYNIKQNGLLCGLPYIGTYLAGLLSTYLAAKWLKEKRFKIITVRRIFASIAFGGPILMLIIEVCWGQIAVVSILVFNVWLICGGCFVASLTANVIDITPKYGSTLLGIAYTIVPAITFLQMVIISSILKDDKSITQWKNVFYMLIGVNTFGLLLFVGFAKGEVQKWNYLEEEQLEKKNYEELKKIIAVKN